MRRGPYSFFFQIVFKILFLHFSFYAYLYETDQMSIFFIMVEKWGEVCNLNLKLYLCHFNHLRGNRKFISSKQLTIINDCTTLSSVYRTKQFHKCPSLRSKKFDSKWSHMAYSCKVKSDIADKNDYTMVDGRIIA